MPSRILVPVALLALFPMTPLRISITPIGRYTAPAGFNVEAAEIAGYDPESERVFSTNIAEGAIDAIDISDPRAPVLAYRIDLAPYGSHANSVAVSRGIVAAAVENTIKTDRGAVVLFDAEDGRVVKVIEAGFQPDMVTFSPNGRWLLVANEGEPNEEYTIDPEGSVTIVDLRRGAANVTASDVRTAAFSAFNDARLDPSVRVFGPRATVAQDLEPEFIAVSPDSRTAWVTLQENNAIGILDIDAARFVRIVGLGLKDHRLAGNGLDPSDRDGGINIARHPVLGMYQPDAIAAFEVRDQTFLVMANEGDARDWDGFGEEVRVADVTLDRGAFPDAVALQSPAALGRLRITKANGDADGDGDYDELWSFGARSVSIRRATGQLVWDSGDALERLVASTFAANFNSEHTSNTFDTRSDDKGPEPEGVAVGVIDGHTFAFVALERAGGVVVYEVTSPASPLFLQYINPRNFTGAPATGTAGDLGPEGMVFIPARESPNGKALVVVSQEVSGTTTIYEVRAPR